MSDDRVKQAEERLATLRKVTKAEGALDSANATHYDWQKEVQPYAEVAAEMAQFISVSVVSWLRKTTSTEYDVTGVDLLLSARRAAGRARRQHRAQVPPGGLRVPLGSHRGRAGAARDRERRLMELTFEEVVRRSLEEASDQRHNMSNAVHRSADSLNKIVDRLDTIIAQKATPSGGGDEPKNMTNGEILNILHEKYHLKSVGDYVTLGYGDRLIIVKRV